MKASELRIGNYVYNVGVIITFEEGDWDCIVNRVFSRTPMERYLPIPLTEDWLLKFGFVKYGEWFCKNDLNISIIHSKTTFGCNEEYQISNIEYVHQLQNLYFALTNKELSL